MLDKLVADFCNIVFDLINYYLSKNIEPDLIVRDIKELSSDALDDLIMNGIKGLIIDLDETLRFAKEDITKVNQEWLQMAKSKLKIVVLSNGYSQNTKKYLKNIGINYIGLAYKPSKSSFKKALQDLNLGPDEVFMIGDDYFSDIYGGSRNKLRTVLINKKIK